MKRRTAPKKKGIASKLMIALVAVCGRFYNNGKFSASPETSSAPDSAASHINVVVSESAQDCVKMDEAHEAISEHTEEKVATREQEFQAHMGIVEADRVRRLKERAAFDAENGITPYTRARNKIRAWEWMYAEMSKRGPDAARRWEKSNPRPELLTIDEKHLVSGDGVSAHFDAPTGRDRTNGIYTISTNP